jgi:hypothetical protein
MTWPKRRKPCRKPGPGSCVATLGESANATIRVSGHERWAYDDSNKVQALRRLICLCTDCHTTTHFGLASINGKSAEAFKHLCTVTGLPANQVRQHIDAVFALWRSRSAITWDLDLNILIKANITVTKPLPRLSARIYPAKFSAASNAVDG